MWWQETRHPSEKVTGVPPPQGVPRAVPQMQPLKACTSRQPPQCFWPKQHPQLRGLGSAARDGVLHPTKVPKLQDCGSSSQRLPTRWVSSSSQPPPPRTFVCGRPHLSSYHQEYNRLLPRVSTARSVGFVRLTVGFDSVLMKHMLAVAKTIKIGSTAGVLSCLVRQADTLLSLPTCILIWNQLLSFCSSRQVQLRSFRSFPGTRILHLTQINAPWRTTSMDLGTLTILKKEAGFVTDRSLAENVYVITQHR